MGTGKREQSGTQGDSVLQRLSKFFFIAERSVLDCSYLLNTLSKGWEEDCAARGFLVDSVAHDLEPPCS